MLLSKQGAQIDLQATALREEIERRDREGREREAEKRIAQAREVHVQFTPMGGGSDGVHGYNPVEVTVANRSERVINDVWAKVWCTNNETDPPEHLLSYERLLPDTSHPIRVTFTYSVLGLAPSDHPRNEYAAEVTFRDSNGVRWRIDKDHKLSEG